MDTDTTNEWNSILMRISNLPITDRYGLIKKISAFLKNHAKALASEKGIDHKILNKLQPVPLLDTDDKVIKHVTKITELLDLPMWETKQRT